MWKQRFYTLAFVLLSYPLHSQILEKKLEQWDRQNPIQKLYLQFDHETYFAGQTMWFKAYFLSGNAPSSKSSTMYVELLNHFGYTSYAWAGENLAMNNWPAGEAANEAIKGLMNSPTHRANILAGDFSRIGVGEVSTADGRHFFTMIFLG